MHRSATLKLSKRMFCNKLTTYQTVSKSYLVHEVLCQSSCILHTTQCRWYLEQEDTHHLQHVSSHHKHTRCRDSNCQTSLWLLE